MFPCLFFSLLPCLCLKAEGHLMFCLENLIKQNLRNKNKNSKVSLIHADMNINSMVIFSFIPLRNFLLFICEMFKQPNFTLKFNQMILIPNIWIFLMFWISCYCISEKNYRDDYFFKPLFKHFGMWAKIYESKRFMGQENKELKSRK